MTATTESPYPGSKLLRQWRKLRGHTLTTAAELLGCSIAALSRAENGLRSLALPTAIALEGISAGHVPAAAWVARADARELRARRTPAKVTAALTGRALGDCEAERRGDDGYRRMQKRALGD